MARGIPTQGQMRSQFVVLAGANFVATLRFSDAVLLSFLQWFTIKQVRLNGPQSLRFV